MKGLLAWADSTIARRLRDGRSEDGFTLIELMWYVVLTILVLGIPLGLLVQAIYGQDTSASRSVAVRQAETGLEQLTRDLRQATAATISSSAGGTTASATLTLPVRVATPSLTSSPSTTQVTWTCSTTSPGTCKRQIQGNTAQPLIYGVTSACLDPTANACTSAVSVTNPSYLYLTIKARVVSQQPNAYQNGTAAALENKPINALGDVTLSDGVDMRNFS